MSGGRLVVLDRAGRDVKRYSLPDGLVTLGSDPGSDIRVMLPTVSGHHATVVVRSNQTIVRNVSDGETLVNGQPISVAALKHGDTITLGDRSLRWEYDQPSAIRAVNNPPSLLVKKTGKQRGRPRKRASDVTTRRLDPGVQFMLEINHRASMPGAGKQVAIVQPQRRDASVDQDTTPRLLVKPHRPYVQANKRQRSSKDAPKAETPEKTEEKSKRKSSTPKFAHKTPDLTTKASQWIESRKSSSKTTPKVEALSTPRRVVASAKRNTPLRTVVLRKAITPNMRFVATTPRKTPVNVAKIQAPLEIDHTKQAALMLMAGHTPRSKLISPKQASGKKNARFVKKTSPVKKSPKIVPVSSKHTTLTPQSTRKSGRKSNLSVDSTLNNYSLKSNGSERSSRSSGKQSMTILEITDSDLRQSRSTRRSEVSSWVESPLLPSPKKSAMKDPRAKKTVRKTDSKIQFDLSNLENYSQENDVFIVSNTTRNRSLRSSSSMSENDLTLHYTDSSHVNSPSPRASINSRSSRILGSVIGASMDVSHEKSTLTPESPNARKSIRGSLMVQNALESPGGNVSSYSNRITKSIDRSKQDANRTRTLSPRSPRRIGESYSIVDLVSFESNESLSSSEYNSVRSSTTTYVTPQKASRKTRSTIDTNLLMSSTPNVNFPSRSSRASKRKSSPINTDKTAKRSKSLSTPDKRTTIASNRSLSTPANAKRPISVNSTRSSRSLGRSQNDISLLQSFDPNASSKTSRSDSRVTETTLNISNNSISSRNSSPKSPRNSSAIATRNNTPKSPRNSVSNRSSITSPKSNSLRNSSDKSPRLTIGKSNRNSKMSSSRTSNVNLPRLSNNKTLTTPNGKSPRSLVSKTSSAKSTRASKTMSPRISRVQSPNILIVRSPSVSNASSPRLLSTVLPRTSSPLSPKLVSPKSNEKSRRNSRKNLSVNIQRTPSVDGFHTPENTRSPEEASTPILSIQSLLNSSQASVASDKSPKRSRASINLKRKTIGVIAARSEPRMMRNAAKSKSLNASTIRKALARLSKDSSQDSDKTDEDASQPSNNETITPKSTVKLVQEAVKEKHSTAKKPQSKRSIIDNLNDSDIVKQLFSSPVKRKLSQSMTEFSRKQSLELNRKKTRKTIAPGRTPEVSFSNYTVTVAPEEFVSPLTTPANSPNVSRIQRLFRNTSQKNQSATKVQPVARTRKSVRNDLTNVSGIKRVFAKSPRNSLTNLRGVKDVFASPPVNDLRRVSGVKALFQSTRKGRTPKNDLTDVVGVRELYKAKSPRNDLGHLSGVKKTLRRSPKNDLTDVRGVKRLFNREKTRDDLNDLSGVEELFDSSFNSEKGKRNASNSEILFDQLVGKPHIRATYAKSFAANTANKNKDRRAAKSLNVSFDLISNNVEEWLEKEIQKRVSKNESVASTSRNRKSNASSSRKSINKSKNVSIVPKELQNLITDTVEGNEPFVASRVRTSTMLKSIPDIPDTNKSVSQRSLPIKKRSFVEASLEKTSFEKSANQSKSRLPIKKRALVHSTPVKGQWNLTADASTLGRVSPIVADKTMDFSRSARQAPGSPKSKPTSPNVKASPKATKTITTQANRTPKKSGRVSKVQGRAEKVSPVKRTRSTRGKKSTDANEITNTKKRRTSLVITKKAPIISPKPSRKVTRKGVRNEKGETKIQTPKASPKKTTKRTGRSKVSPKKVIATKATRGKRISTPLASPKKATKATRRKVDSSKDSSKDEITNDSAKKITRGKKVDSPKVSPKKATRGKKFESTKVSPKNATRGVKILSPKVIPKKATKGKKIESPKVSPKKTTRGKNVESSKVSPRKATRGKNIESPKVSPKKATRSKKVVSPKVSPKKTTRGKKAVSPKVSPQKTTTGKRVEDKPATPKATRTRVNKKSNLVVSKPSPQLKPQTSRQTVKKAEQPAQPKNNRGKNAPPVVDIETKRGATKNNITEVLEKSRTRNTNKSASDKTSPAKRGRNRIVIEETITRAVKAQVEKAPPKRSRGVPKEALEIVPRGRKRKVTDTAEISANITTAVSDVKTKRGRRNADVEVQIQKPQKTVNSKTKKGEKSAVAEKTTRKTAQKETEVVKPVRGKKAAEEVPKVRKRKSDTDPTLKKGNMIPAKRARRTAEPKKSASPVKSGKTTRRQNTETKASTSTTRSRRR